MIDNAFGFAWPDYIDLSVTIEWTKPFPYDFLFSGEMAENDTAYFYAIVGFHNKKWKPFYVGMTCQQNAAIRHKQQDHKTRLGELKAKYGIDFSLSLGTPSGISDNDLTAETIGEIEGLLIYANWHDDMVNKRKIDDFSSKRQIYIRNTGWTSHTVPELAYGTMVKR